MKHFIETETDN
jgi:hypothetical protein